MRKVFSVLAACRSLSQLAVRKPTRQLINDQRGAVFVEYLLLLTIIGIGVIAGLAVVRGALTNELIELASAINAIRP